MKTYTVTIKVPHYYDYKIQANTKQEAKEIVLSDDFLEQSCDDLIDWSTQEIEEISEDK